ncbi:MAG: MCT family MFS transporter [Candidatus Binataceae bacterium]
MIPAHLHTVTRHERDSPHAWRTVAAGFLACFTLFGIAYSFGAFFKPMAKEFGASREAISAIFSITSFLYFLLGPITGHLADRFGPRPVVAAGALTMGAGLIATGSIHHLWFGYLTYGLGVGIGVACCYVPLVAVVSGWFLKRRNTALGIAVSGIGAGTLAVAPLSAELIEHFGWRTAYVSLGIAATLALLVCAWLSEAPPVEFDPSPAPPLANKLKTRDFVILYIAAGLWTIATAVPFVFLQPYARDNRIGEVAAATLVGIIGFASTAGRLGLGVMADRMGIIRLYQLCVLVLGLCFSLWLFGHSYAPLVAFALLMGASYGGAVTLTPAVLAELFGTQGLGLLLGTLYTSSALGTLLGPPFAGAIIDHTGSYTLAVIFTGATSVLAFLILIPLGTVPRNRPMADMAPRPASD